MPDYGTPPEIPAELQQYNSYVTDPIYQRKFTYVWVAAVGVTILYVLLRPSALGRTKRAFQASSARTEHSWVAWVKRVFGVWEDNGREYELVPSEEKGSEVRAQPSRRADSFQKVGRAVHRGALGIFGWGLPGIELDLGQIIIVIGYIITAILCVVMNSELITNANRAGFLAIAQLPVVFLFSTKNSLLSIISSSVLSYDKINFIHRWSGRTLFICALLHGSLWISNHLSWNLPIIGQQKETSGVAALGVLCVLVLSSLRWVRRFWYEGFFLVHVLGYVAFFVTICYHTIYAVPWIFPPLAFLGFDYFMRMVRYRIKDATLLPVDKNMTLIQIHDSDGGWKAGQHIRLRVFLGSRIFETHPLTIANAPASASCLSKSSRGHGITLAARTVGDWTRAINTYAVSEQTRLALLDPKSNGRTLGVPLQVMIDGPYGGPTIDVGDYENVLLVAGGSGASFTIGVLDDIVGRCCVNGRRGGEQTRRIEFVWCIKSFGCIQWFAPMLQQIANTVAAHRAKAHGGESSTLPLDLHISVYVTCLCDPEAVPVIPNSDVLNEKPTAHSILKQFVSPPLPSEKQSSPRDSMITKESSSDMECGDETRGMLKSKLDWVGLEGGVGVCVSGPEGLIREMGNAVSLLGLKGAKGSRLGKIGIHTELFAI